MTISNVNQFKSLFNEFTVSVTEMGRVMREVKEVLEGNSRVTMISLRIFMNYKLNGRG